MSTDKKQLNIRLDTTTLTELNTLSKQLNLSYPETLKTLIAYFKDQHEKNRDQNISNKKLNNLTKQTNIMQYYNALILKLIMTQENIKFDDSLLNFSLKNQPASLDEMSINTYNEIENKVISDFRFIKLNNDKPAKINSSENDDQSDHLQADPEPVKTNLDDAE